MISIEDMTFEQLYKFLTANEIVMHISDIAWANMTVNDKKLFAQDVYSLINKQ